MLYMGAVEGLDRYLAPKHVYRMGDEQAALTSDAQRLHYAVDTLRSGSKPLGQPWYADTSKEQIRDETINKGFVPVGAVLVKKDVPTSSSKGRYALARGFAALFDPVLQGDQLNGAIEAWQQEHLSPDALRRIRLVAAGRTIDAAGVRVTFPNGETRRLSAGPSSVIAKGVIEHFAPRFLDEPVVIWLSDGASKVVEKDDLVATSIGLQIDPSRALPDLILADLRNGGGRPVLLVFVEIVASDGPIDAQRRDDLRKIAAAGGFPEERLAFLTAFEDRAASSAKKCMPGLAWNSFAWFMSEPDNIIALFDTGDAEPRLHELMRTKLKR